MPIVQQMRSDVAPARSMPEFGHGRLAELFFSHAGNISDKWEQYLPIYQSELARFIARGTPVRLLEIGVQNGGSLQVWSKFLPPGSSIIGMDIDPACGDLALGDGIRVLIGNAADPAVLDSLLGDAVFDVIVDDGSHRSDHIIATFEACFPRLAADGLYVVEDIHCSYFASHAGGFRAPGAAMEWFKALADAPNADHFEADASTSGVAELERLRLLNRSIARLSFLDSVVTIQKLPAEKQSPYRRIMAGCDGPVVDPANALINLPIPQLGSLTLGPATAAALEAPFTAALATNRAALTASQAELAAARADLAEESGRVALLETELIWLRSSHGTSAKVPEADVVLMLEAAEQRATDAEARLGQFQAGASWRTMQFIRRLAGLVPGPLRQGLTGLLRR